jgi:hypothetical protein
VVTAERGGAGVRDAEITIVGGGAVGCAVADTGVREVFRQPGPSPYVRSLIAARFLPRGWDWESAREQAQRRYEDYYSLATIPARGES